MPKLHVAAIIALQDLSPSERLVLEGKIVKVERTDSYNIHVRVFNVSSTIRKLQYKGDIDRQLAYYRVVRSRFAFLWPTRLFSKMPLILRRVTPDALVLLRDECFFSEIKLQPTTLEKL